MPNSLSSLPNNLAKGLHKSKYKRCKSFLEYVQVKKGSLIFKYLNCGKTKKKVFMNISRKHSQTLTNFVTEALINFV